ncbi:MAG: 5-(carboxyamino)imidazole ribonucleotide synthase [Verrucomicrobiae bacterium]|nr:5-(carboxyamino)imidazole ribonucleotide synthase [Verrucomicrobiae bacterium]
MNPAVSGKTSNSNATAPLVRTLGIIGGGQLAKMTAIAAAQLGCRIVVLERSADCPAASVAAQTLVGDLNDLDALLRLAGMVEVVTLENEFVNPDVLARVEQAGHAVWPTASTMRLVQDKLIQKETLLQAGLPVPRFAPAPTLEAALAAAAQFGWPVVLKRRKLGYDGKGNATARSAAELESSWAYLDGVKNPLYVEEFCPFRTELAVIVTRSRTGEAVVYPVTETINRNHICNITKTPAPVPRDTAQKVVELAQRAADAINMVGSMGLELFWREDGTVLINEIAPRVHNTGHYTIEACECSQFENHVRAVLGWPLGSPAMRAPAAVMVNLLGHAEGIGTPFGLTQALSVPGAHVHIYGKTRTSPGRKMGHVTALGRTLDEALALAQRAANCIRFGQPE